MNNHRRGVLLMIGAALCWSIGGLLVRLVSFADPWEIVFWRSAFMTLFIIGVLAHQYGAAAGMQIRSVGLPGVVSGTLFASMFFFFILSLTRTTVANTMALTSLSPFFAALFGAWFLAERIALRTWVAIAVSLAGITMMFAEAVDAGTIAGNLYALGVPIAFGLNLLVLKRTQARVDMIPAVLIAGVVSIAVALPLAWPLTPTLSDLGLLSILGVVQLGMGCLLMTLAVRHLSAAEVGLYSLLENVLSPVWAWIGVGERPGDLALAGALVVIGSIAGNQWLAAREGGGP
jgi:drug/metabolite transporter (DMT)-like permease